MEPQAQVVVGESNRSAADDLRLPRPPGFFRRFWARHPRLTDALLVAITLLLTIPTFVLVGEIPQLNSDTPLLVTSVVLVVVTAVSLLWRRRHPLTVFAITFTPIVLLEPGLATSVTGVAPIIALYSVAVHRSARAAAWMLAVAIAGIGVSVLAWSVAGGLEAGEMLTVALAASVPLIIGALVGITVGGRKRYEAALIDRSRQLAIERDQQARLAAAAERTRLAREMHDIVSHSLAVIVALAEGAVATDDTERARSAGRAIADTARESLSQMRVMLGVLRTEPDDTTPLEPLLAQAPHDVVATARDAGYPVTLKVKGAAAVSDAQRLAVLRIVQEGLTNAMRYAHHPTRIAVTTDYTGGRIRVLVDNDGAQSGEPSRGAGLGLIGLTERVIALGGTLQAGPAASGHWRLVAELPLEFARD